MKYLFLVLLFLTSCSSGNATLPHIPVAQRVRAKAAKQIQARYGAKPCGYGGELMYQIDNIWLAFDAVGDYEIGEARKYFIPIATAFIDEIKNDPEAIKYLSDPTNPVNAVSISLSFKTKNKLIPTAPHINHIYMVSGKIWYTAYQGPSKLYQDIQKETYQEALEALNADQTSSCLK